MKLKIHSSHSLQSPKLYVEFYDSRECLVAVAYLNEIEDKGSGMIEVEIPYQRPDRPFKTRVALFSNDEELWTVEASVEEHRY